MRRVFPYPLLAIAMVIMWMMLTTFTPGQFLIGVGVAIIGGLSMVRLQPDPVRIGSWKAIPLLFWRVLIDVTQSNIAVARIILTGGRAKSRSGFMVIPLELKDRTGLAVLGCILTATPGTAWIAYDARESELLLHVLDLENEDSWRNLIKDRYEKALLEIFVEGDAK